MNPYELINAIHKYKLENILPNISVALRIFLTIPVTVASAERSFSKLKLVKFSQEHHVTRSYGFLGKIEH